MYVGLYTRFAVVTNLGRRLAGVELQPLTLTAVRSFCSHTHTHTYIRVL